ncbi:L,D-transpeptidase family protein [Advenella sp. RU8]|uniref:L,D-transpeptidase family protein n=1 Tax=Advenella sp. RU8 TaxID=3399575 RepID=UPI003AAC1442
MKIHKILFAVLLVAGSGAHVAANVPALTVAEEPVLFLEQPPVFGKVPESAVVISSQMPLSWFDGNRPVRQTQQAIALLEQAGLQGLNPADYPTQSLKQQLAQAKGGQLSSEQVARLDNNISRVMRAYVKDLKNGRVDPASVKQKFNRIPITDAQADALLQNALQQDNLASLPESITSPIPMYGSLLKVLAHYKTLVGNPAWQTPLPSLKGNGLKPGQPYAGLAVVQARLEALGDLSPGAAVPAVYDSRLVQGIKNFQERHGLEPDGVIGKGTLEQLAVTPGQRVRQIEISLERLRWTPLTTHPRMIVVNVPEFILRGYNVKMGKIEPQIEMKVIVGKAFNTSTPLFDGEMKFIEFSPYWNIPPSIARSETIPRLRRDPGYLSRQGMEFVLGNGVSTVVSEANINAVLAGKARIRQRPGPQNALGDIKFIFPNNMSIFLHHTPSVGLFDRTRRDFSHGCIRVEAPVELAQFILVNQPEWTAPRIKSAMEARKSNTIKLEEPIPVVLAYSTVVVKNNKTYFFPDLYGQDKLLNQALLRHTQQQASKPLLASNP